MFQSASAFSIWLTLKTTIAASIAAPA